MNRTQHHRPEPGGAELVRLRRPAAKKEGGEALPRIQSARELYALTQDR
ncbi:hypothetical protein [Streptomyces sp. NPDC058572]